MDWQVQSTALVDDVLVPSRYVAVATYAGKASYSKPIGYISTAEYKGTVSCNEVTHVTYTVLYVGSEVNNAVGVAAWIADHKLPVAIGGVAVLGLLGAGAYQLVRHKRENAEYEEATEHETEQ